MWKLLRGSLVVASGKKCSSFYRTVLHGSKTGGIFTHGSYTKKVWGGMLDIRK